MGTGGGGGGGCCGGGDEPATPDSIISKFLPKLTDTLVEILSEAPFNGEKELATAKGDKIKFKGETLVKTILNFTIRVLGGRLQQKRKIRVETKGTEVTVTCEKLPFVREDSHSSKRRDFIMLTNQADFTMQIFEIPSISESVTKKFKINPATEGDDSGENKCKAFVVSGDGQIDAGSRIKSID